MGYAIRNDGLGWRAVESAADCLDGETYSAVQPPEIVGRQADIVRAQRDAKLAVCDWTQLPDAPLSAEAKTAWGEYRQALRDVPEQVGFPGEVDWPVVPGA